MSYLENGSKLPTIHELYSDQERLWKRIPDIANNISYEESPTMTELVQYRLLTEKLDDNALSHEQLFRWKLNPLICNLGQRGYIERSILIDETIQLIRSMRELPPRSVILKMFRQPFLETIVDGIRRQDDSLTEGALLSRVYRIRVFQRLYGELRIEDYHTLFNECLTYGDQTVLRELVVLSDSAGDSYEISEESKRLAVELFARAGDIESTAILWTYKELSSLEISLVAECSEAISDKLDIIQLAPDDTVLSIMDFDHLVEAVKVEMLASTVARRDIEIDSQRRLRINLQRVDINNFWGKHIDNEFQKYDDRVKQLFYEAVLKALVQLTNNTGMVHAFTKLQIKDVNKSMLETLMFAAIRGAGARPVAESVKRFIDQDPSRGSGKIVKMYNDIDNTPSVEGRTLRDKKSAEYRKKKEVGDSRILNRFFKQVDSDHPAEAKNPPSSL